MNAELFVSANAEAAEAAARAESTHEERVPSSDHAEQSFEQQLHELREMGFENDELLLEILRRNKGIVQRAINDLLSQ